MPESHSPSQMAWTREFAIKKLSAARLGDAAAAVIADVDAAFDESGFCLTRKQRDKLSPDPDARLEAARLALA